MGVVGSTYAYVNLQGGRSGDDPAFGDPTKPISVSYAVSGGQLIRTQTIQATGATSSLVICSNVTDLQLAFVTQTTTVTFAITFDPKSTDDGANTTEPAGTPRPESAAAAERPEARASRTPVCRPNTFGLKTTETLIALS